MNSKPTTPVKKSLSIDIDENNAESQQEVQENNRESNIEKEVIRSDIESGGEGEKPVT